MKRFPNTRQDVYISDRISSLITKVAACGLLFACLLFAGSLYARQQRTVEMTPAVAPETPEQIHADMEELQRLREANRQAITRENEVVRQQMVYIAQTFGKPLLALGSGYLMMFMFSCLKTWGEYNETKSALRESS